MTPQWAAFLDAEPWLLMAGLMFLRVGAIVGLAPVFGEHVVPMRLRLVAAMAFAACLFPLLPPLGLSAGQALLPLAAAECVMGLGFGMLLRLMVLGLQMAGAMIAQVMSLSQIAGAGVAAEPAPAIGNLLMAGGLALAATGGLHVRVLDYMMQSYFLVPLGAWPSAEHLGVAGLSGVVRTTSLALSLAMPFVALALFYNVMMGVMNRAMPQMMVVFVGAPVIVGISLAALGMLSPLLLHLWHDALSALLAAPGAVI